MPTIGHEGGREVITIVSGNIFESDCQVLTSPVNCKGRSGAGLALLFKKRFPKEEKLFIEWCKEGKLKLGTVLTVCREDVPTSGYICYFPTKDKPSDTSNIRSLYEGLISLRQLMLYEGANSVALPALGCGLGGLEFATLEKAVRYVFDDWPELSIDLYRAHK